VAVKAPGKRMKSQDLREEEIEVEAAIVAEEDLEEVEEVATIGEEAAVVLQVKEEISATTARVSVILQESALSHEKKEQIDPQEMTTRKIVAHTREERTMMVEISTTTMPMGVVVQLKAEEVGTTSQMRGREAHGTKRKTMETSGQVKATL